MKKTILTAITALAMTGFAFAQGNVNWGSISFSYMTAQTNTTTYSAFTGGGATGSGVQGAAGGSASLGSGFYYELLYNGFTGSQAAVPTTLSALNTWTDGGLKATNSNTAGRLAVVTPNTGTTVAWASPTTTNSIMLVGWSANLGTTWAAASTLLNNWASQGNSVIGNAFFGVSNTGFITAVDTATSPGANVFGPVGITANGQPINSLNTQLFLLNPVPEPSTMVLAGLGGLSLLAFRRKK